MAQACLGLGKFFGLKILTVYEYVGQERNVLSVTMGVKKETDQCCSEKYVLCACIIQSASLCQVVIKRYQPY